jgi:ankyrin repeat protein
MAVTYNNIEMLKYLLQEGVKINQTQRKSGFTALMAAACYGRAEITKILIENGVDQEARDMKGFRAVDFARKMNKKSVLKLLNYEEFEEKNTGHAR